MMSGLLLVTDIFYSVYSNIEFALITYIKSYFTSGYCFGGVT